MIGLTIKPILQASLSYLFLRPIINLKLAVHTKKRIFGKIRIPRSNNLIEILTNLKFLRSPKSGIT